MSHGRATPKKLARDPRRACAVDLANRLGFVHVDDLLDSLTPEEFEERFQHYLMTGAGDSRRFVAAIAAELRNLIPRYFSAKSGQQLPAKAYWDEEELLPTEYRRKRKKQPTIQSAEEMAKALGC